MMKRKFYFYKYVWKLKKSSSRSRLLKWKLTKFVCGCNDCKDILPKFRCKKLYKNFFNFHKLITMREIQNLNCRIFSYCSLTPFDFFNRDSSFLMWYTEFFFYIAQVYLLVMKHGSFRLGYIHRK